MIFSDSSLLSPRHSTVAVVCAVVHPNLVRLMGYATKPRLYIVQELLRGQALDKQLYVERFRPSVVQIMQMALGVAEGASSPTLLLPLPFHSPCLD